jgi:enamine deaminase RidA (YjgF/YER057c/UK114 family)
MTNKHLRKYYLPSGQKSFHEQLAECINQIGEIRRNNSILQITFFLRAGDNNEFVEKRNLIYLSLNKILHSDIPSISIVGQIPDSREISIELVYFHKDTLNMSIRYKSVGQVNYTVVESEAERAIFAGGITSINHLNGQKSVQAEAAFQLMDEILKNESMTFGNVIRQWNYIEDIVGFDKKAQDEIQNYQAFNDTRTRYYATSSFENGYPAATGIGMNAGGIIIEFYANKPFIKEEIIPIRNPQQKDAYQYSQEVLIGEALNKQTMKSAPKFERAKYISAASDKIVFISGTASIKGEKTIGIDDIAIQTKTTIENIWNLISRENLQSNQIHNNYNQISFSSIRVYVKKAEHMEVVREICQAAFPMVGINYLIADICRESLLVEIEGIAELNL